MTIKAVILTGANHMSMNQWHMKKGIVMDMMTETRTDMNLASPKAIMKANQKAITQAMMKVTKKVPAKQKNALISTIG